MCVWQNGENNNMSVFCFYAELHFFLQESVNFELRLAVLNFFDNS